MAKPPVPQKPYALKTGSVSCSSVTIAWDVIGNVSPITHYTVFYKTAEEDDDNWHCSMTQGPHKVLRINDLKPDTAYQFKVASNTHKKEYSPGPISDIIRTFRNIAPTPQKPRVREVTHNSVLLCWCVTGDTSNVTHYTIKYTAYDEDTNFAPTDHWKSYHTKNTECNCTIKDLVPNTSYRFCVTSNTGKGRSDLSPISHRIKTKPCETSNANSTTTCPNQDLHCKPQQYSNPALAATTSEDCGTMKCLQTVAGKIPPIPQKPTCSGHASHDSIPLTWKVGGNTVTPLVTHYTITYRDVSGKGPLMTFETKSADTYCTVKDLHPDTSYQFCVASNTDKGQSQQSENSDIIKTAIEIPNVGLPEETPPQPLKPFLGGFASHNCVPLEWQVPGDTNPVTHYTVTYKEVGKRTWIVHKTDNTNTSCTVNDLEPLTSYHFRVSSNTQKGSSPPSEISDVIRTLEQQKWTDPDQTPPQPQKPTALAFGQTTVLLKWSVTGNIAHVTHYTVTYKIANKNANSLMFETEKADTSYLIEDLEPGTPYQFQVASNTKRWQSTPSEESDTIYTHEKPQTKIEQNRRPPKPNSPKMVEIPSHDSVSLCWEVPDNTTHVTHYTVSYHKADANKGSWITEETNGTGTSYTIHGLEPETSYQFRVASNTVDGQSPPSEASDVIRTKEDPHITDLTPPKPNKPKLNGTPGHNSVPLSWEVQGNTTHITHYTLGYKAAGDEGHWKTIETKNTNPYYTIEDLEPETSYKFCVLSNTGHGRSQRSEPSDNIQTNSDSTTDQKPHKPNKPKVVDSPGHNSVQLCWTVQGNTSHILHYTISYRKTDANKGTWMTVATNDTDKSYTIEDLQPGTYYEFRVAANTEHEQSLPSEVSKAIRTSAIPDSTINKKPPKPNKPNIVNTPDHTSVKLCWTVPGITTHVTHYMLSYRKTDSIGNWFGNWMAVETESADTSCTIHDLEPGNSYRFRVASNTEQGQSPQSEISNPFQMPKAPKPGEAPKYVEVKHEQRIPTVPGPQLSPPTRSSAPSKDVGHFVQESLSPGQIYRKELQKKSKLTKSENGMPVYQVPLILTNKLKAERIQMLDFGISPALPKPEKVILVLGATGAGKSTLINGLLNYITGVEWAEKSRFRLVEESASFAAQHKSQTQKISIYTLHHHEAYNIPYTLKIIDTPGFGDTAGISKDELLTESIRNLFSTKAYGIDHIDAIGFVVQCSSARLTPTQTYIFDSILSLFGKDIGDNIFLLITFSDSQLPPVLASTKEAKIPFKSYFKFNNSALFANIDTEGNEFDQMFWKMGVKSFQKFLTELGNVEGKSLYLTKDALEERQQLEVCIEGIKQEIHKSLTKLEQLKAEIAVVKLHEADIEKNRNFEYTVEEHKMVKENLEEGQHVTNCFTCNRTCHFPCRIPCDKDKRCCWAMDKRGKCRICPGNCWWNFHHNDPYMIKVETAQVTKAAHDLKRRYQKAKGEKMNAANLVEKILEDFHTLRIKILYMVTEVTRTLTRLSEIALKPNPLSTLDYLDILITSERAEGNPGFLARIEHLEDVKAEAIMLDCQMTVNPFGKYRHMIKSIHDTQSFEDIAAEIRMKNPSILNDLYKKITSTYK